MISYTTRYVNIVSLLITIIIYFFLIQMDIFIKKFDFDINLISNIFKRNTILVELNSSNINQDTKEDIKIQNNIPQTNTQEKELNVEKAEKNSNWKIIIPKISLEAEISEGTSKEIMDRYVGHFEKTSKNIGNIGLAAHNRGYNVNYFAQIKLLEENDEIIYKCNDFEKTYMVVENKIIKDTDWNCLQNTEENTITLITCVENEPEYRRCIQGVEK